jgi:endonuclease-3
MEIYAGVRSSQWPHHTAWPAADSRSRNLTLANRIPQRMLRSSRWAFSLRRRLGTTIFNKWAYPTRVAQVTRANLSTSLPIQRFEFPAMIRRAGKKRQSLTAHRNKQLHQSAELLAREVNRRLPVSGPNPHGNHRDPLDELVFILLSAQTESYLYRDTYRALRAAYRPWRMLLVASHAEVMSVIRRGGLASKKARQLRAAFKKITIDRGELSLRFLRKASTPEALAYLISLPGIGVKSAKCVMMYSLDRAVFPVDTHVWRVSRRLGIAAPSPKPSAAQEQELEERIPGDIRHDLHVKLVSHGKDVCRTYFQRCDECVLSDLCPTSGQLDPVWTRWRQPKGVWATASPISADRKRNRIA